MASGNRCINYWVNLAMLLARGGFTSLFLAGVHGSYNIYRGSRDTAVRHAVHFPSNDPTMVIAAMAHTPKAMGVGCAFSTTYLRMKHTAKVFSTLDTV